MTAAVDAMALFAAAIAAAHPHGKMMFGPIAANVAWNSAMISISCTRAWETLVAAVARLLFNSSDWAPTSDPLEIAFAVFAAALVPDSPCHELSTEASDWFNEPPVDWNACEMPCSIAVGSTPSNRPLPKVPSASVTGLISALGSIGLACGCASSGRGSCGGFPSCALPSANGGNPSRSRISLTGKFK